MPALKSFTERVIVGGNDLLLSYTCSFLRLLECKVVLLHNIGGQYRGIKKNDFFFFFSVCFEFLNYWDDVLGFTNP